MLTKMIKERKDKESIQDPSVYDHKDVLQYLLSIEDNIFTDAQIKDNILTMIIAGNYIHNHAHYLFDMYYLSTLEYNLT